MSSWESLIKRRIRELEETLDSSICKTEKEKFGVQQQLLCIRGLAKDMGNDIIKQRADDILRREFVKK